MATLNHELHGSGGAEGDRPALIIAHGLFGSARNWRGVARRLGERRLVVAVDMRNHGKSPHLPGHSYDDLAGDLAETCRCFQPPVDVLGHSMGGKAAMVLACTRPELVRRLVVGDIAPVRYAHSQRLHINAMRHIDLGQSLLTRAGADAKLARYIDDPAQRAFLLQSLDRAAGRWNLNLGVLDAEMDAIMGFPGHLAPAPMPALFVAGERSDYLLPEHKPAIRALFPATGFSTLNGAGHWLHADMPAEFVAVVEEFLCRQPGGA